MSSDDRLIKAQAFHTAHLRATLLSLGRSEGASGLDEHLALVETARESTPNGGARLSLVLCQRLGRDAQRYNAMDGELISYYTDFVGRHGKAGMLDKQAMALAEAVAKPPEDAILEESGYETLADNTHYRVRWRREYRGVLVEGDFIEALVNTTVSTVYSFARKWRALSLNWQER
jgi:hypothetical protein